MGAHSLKKRNFEQDVNSRFRPHVKLVVSMYFVCIEAVSVANTGKGICLYKSQLASGHKSPQFIFRTDPYWENHSEMALKQARLVDWLITRPAKGWQEYIWSIT